MQLTIGYPTTRHPITTAGIPPWDMVVSTAQLSLSFLRQHSPDQRDTPMVWDDGDRRAFLGVMLHSRAAAQRTPQLHRAGLSVAQQDHGAQVALLAGEQLPPGPWPLQMLSERIAMVAELWAQQPDVNPYCTVWLCLLPPGAVVAHPPSPPAGDRGARLVDELVARGWLELVPGASAEALEARLEVSSAEALEAILLHDAAVAELYADTDLLRGLLAQW